MESIEIVPEPEPDEREAIRAALAEADAAESRQAAAWARPALGEDDEL